MKLPNKVKIGNHTVSIEERSREEIDNSYGRYRDRDLKIEIDKSLAPSMKAATLVHELLHVCFLRAAIGQVMSTKYKDFSGDDEETIVRALEEPVSYMIGHNPKLIAYLQENIE